MSTLLALFFEFFKTGLFAIGGGLATLPFLYDIAARHDWLEATLLPDMIAVSESTPGPIGINMATYAGYHAYGLIGAVTATVALVLPSIIVIVTIAKFLEKFKNSRTVQSAFTTLRPAVTGLIAAAGWQVFRISVLSLDVLAATGFKWGNVIQVKSAVLFAVICMMQRKLKIHPAFYILGAAVVGVIFRF